MNGERRMSNSIAIRNSAVIAHRKNTTLMSAPRLEDAKLERLVESSDNPIVGPKSAAILAEFASTPEPDFATEADIEAMVAMLATATIRRKASDDEADAQMSQFSKELLGARKADLDAAYSELVRAHKFMPTVAEVYSCVKGFESSRRYRKSRARNLVAIHKREWRPEVELVSPEEMEGLREKIASMSKAD